MSATHIHVFPARQLPVHHIENWSRILKGEPQLDSAFFRPEFTQLVGSVRDDVEVAVLESDGTPVGYFPFQRGRRNVGLPVVGKLSEFHGLIAPSWLKWNADQLIRDSGLSAWQYDHLLASQRPFQEFTWNGSASPYMDLRNGYESYVQAKRNSGSSAVSQVMRKRRKIEREVGPLRFEYHTTDPSALMCLVDWKTTQYRRTKRNNIFANNWVMALLKACQSTQTENFAGVMSVLYVREQPIAVHLGLQSNTAFHIWFPAYSREYDKYSPGLILLLHMAEHVAASGIHRIDFGKGPERYKASFKTGDWALAEGAVDHRPLMVVLRRNWHQAKRWIRATRFRSQLEVALQMKNRLRDWVDFR